MKVHVWEEKILIPTYGTGKPEKNPMFLENRVYQGSSGVVYPNPVIEKILDEKIDKEYRALYLENHYIKIMILPELGGRVQMAYDKIKQRHFVYYNNVIKPALVGLTGPWISGGIEFNWPQHHRPSTFSSVDYTIEDHDDGSKTVWVSEVERMFRTKGMAGFRVYPDKAYLEINAKLYNRTTFPQTFLWWANPAVKASDAYQSIFPPDVHAVFDHGKRDVSAFPIAKGTYYKVDYSAGVDISWYKNIPVPTSYMAVKSKYDFMGGYENDTKGGLLHVANHHVSPGKKQWTWGKGEFGFAWDRNLTDDDGPYVELMTGVFTDNQPDFSWINPFEERTFTQYFMPFSEIGIVKNATKDAFVNVEVLNNIIEFKVYTTALYENAIATISYDGEIISKEICTVSPEHIVEKSYTLKHNLDPLKVFFKLETKEGKTLVTYQPEKPIDKAVPDPAKPALQPAEISSIEQLFLTGLHIEQYRHATYKATDYYQEALRREPGDIRNNQAMGLWLLKRGQFAKAEKYFQTAIDTITERNPNPYDGEPYFNLGICLTYLNRFDEAFDAFYKATWNAGCQDGAYLHLARIAARKGNFGEALSLIEKSILKNYHSHSARHLKSVILRKLGRVEESLQWTNESIAIDAFNFGCYTEKQKLLITLQREKDAVEVLQRQKDLMRANAHTYAEYALDYAHAGFYQEAIELLRLAVEGDNQVDAMVYYYLSHFANQLGNNKEATEWHSQGAHANPSYCFPNRVEDVNILQQVISHFPSDAKAPYYLGNFWYAHRQYDEAISCWELSAEIDATFPTVFRNLALAYHNKRNDEAKALTSLKKAFDLDRTDSRVFMELDQLLIKLNTPVAKRLKLLEEHISLTEERDDLYLERVCLYNQSGHHAIAKELLAKRKFHPWEGGEGKTVGQHLTANIELAKSALEEKEYSKVIQLLNEAEVYPENLGEGKLIGAQENDIFYLKGVAYAALKDEENAKANYQKATRGISEPVQAIYYNDPQPDKIFYQGLAWRKLGDETKAKTIFERLKSFGNEHMNDEIKIDYFAVSLPDLLVFDQDLNLRNQIHCHYLIALGELGLGNYAEAEKHFDFVLKHNVNHSGAFTHHKMLGSTLL